MRRADGQVVLVSGGARGMGEAHARRLIDEGASVVLGDIRTEEGQALAASLGDQARFVELDVTRRDQWAEAVEAAERTFGPVSSLVNNAGIVIIHGFETATDEEWQRVIDVNQRGVFLGIQTVIPSMRRRGGGSIVNVSSNLGMVGYVDLSAYIASKWAVRGLTKAAALELAPLGIRVNSVHPGETTTPMMTELSGSEVPDVSQIPLGRWATPEEVANLVLFLVSDESSSSLALSTSSTVATPPAEIKWPPLACSSRTMVRCEPTSGGWSRRRRIDPWRPARRLLVRLSNQHARD